MDLWRNPPAPAAAWPAVAHSTGVTVAPSKTWPNVADGVATAHSTPAGPVVTPRPACVVPKPKAISAATIAVVPRVGVIRATIDRDDSRARACVPVELTRAVGFTPGRRVYISLRSGGKGLMLMPKVTKTGHVSTYQVDKDGNLRLSCFVLLKGGLTSLRIKFRTTNDGKSIVVVAG